jgi:putative membrane protein
MNKFALLAAAAALSLAACSAETDTNDDMAADAGMPSDDATVSAANDQTLTTTMAMEYVGMAGAGDLYEIESSRLALEKSASDEVKTFAQMMIDNHTATTAEVKAAAEAAGLTPPAPALSPTQQTMLDNLRNLAAEEFDRAYLGQQANAHQTALNLHRTYAEAGDTEQLREVAAAAVPIIERHIAELEGMETL